MFAEMVPPGPADGASTESAVPLKKARRGRVSISSNARVPLKEGRKRPNSMGRDSQQQQDDTTTPNSQSQTNSTGGRAPLPQHSQCSTPMSGPPGKMLLPRLQQPKSSTPDAKASGKERTTHACDKCRKAKAKCSGGQPCEKCQIESRECVYGDGKRDKIRKELERLAKRNCDLAKQSDSMRDFMSKICEDPLVSSKTKGDISEYLSDLKPIDADPEDGDKRRGSGEDDADAQDVASMGSLDAINEDTNRDEDTRAAGYLGKSSAVRWIQRTKDYLDQDDEQKGSQKDAKEPNNAFMDATCHADDSDYPGMGISTESVNPYDLPPLSLARTLVDEYFKHVHPALPILSEPDFRESFDKYIVHSPNQQRQIGVKQQNFLCSVNMVFAIAARHAHVTDADHRGGENDHFIYFTRARAMGLDEKALHEDAELENVTSLGLVSLYFLTLELINRAWTWSGVAIRSALTLGLHLRSQTRSLSDVDKEYRVRIFWSLYCLERVMNQLTGRPSCISPRDICATLPLNVDESSFKRGVALYDGNSKAKSVFYGASAEAAARALPPMPRTLPSDSSRSEDDASPMDTSPVSKLSSTTSALGSRGGSQASPSSEQMASQEMSTSTFFIHRLRLSIISHEIFNDLYSPTMVHSKWGDIQNVMRKIDKSLQQWKESIPWQLRFDPEQPRSAEPPAWKDGEPVRDLQERRQQWKHFAGQRIGLAMMWCSSRMMLYRPTLCRISQEIEHESERSKGFNSNAASKCIQSARNMIACFPPFDSDQGANKRYHSFGSDKDQLGSDVVGIHSFVPWWDTSHYLIEGSSVLIMELAYRADHMPSQAEAMFEGTKTAVAWMRHLAPHSIMARKGSTVYEVLLRRVAPRVGCYAGELTKDGKLPKEWDEARSNKTNGAGHDSSSDTIRWSGHNESAARFEQHPSMDTQQPHFFMQQQQPSHGQPVAQQQNYLQHPQTAGLSPNITTGQMTSNLALSGPTDFSIVELGDLDALENFHFAGGIYGVYDQFGPWFSNGFDNFGVFDPVMDARIAMGVDHTFNGQSQSHSPMRGSSQMGSGSGQMGHAPANNPNISNQQRLGESNHFPLSNVQMMASGQFEGGQLGNQHMGGQINRSPQAQLASHQMSVSQMGLSVGMSTEASMPPVTAGDIGRSFDYDPPQQRQPQLPSMQQIGMGNNMQQGGGYQPFPWDGSLPPVSQSQTPRQQYLAHLPLAHGPSMDPPHNQGMSSDQGQGQHGQPRNMNDHRQSHR